MAAHSGFMIRTVQVFFLYYFCGFIILSIEVEEKNTPPIIKIGGVFPLDGEGV